MKSARIICWQLDSTLCPTSERGFDIIPALLPELILYLQQIADLKSHVIAASDSGCFAMAGNDILQPYK